MQNWKEKNPKIAIVQLVDNLWEADRYSTSEGFRRFPQGLRDSTRTHSQENN